MGTGASRTVYAPGSNPKARISFDLHGCVTLMSMPRTALEPLDSSWQPARFVVLDDRRLQVNRVDHRSLAGCSLHNLGSGQQVAAGARRRGDAPRIRSAARLSCKERATMCRARCVAVPFRASSASFARRRASTQRPGFSALPNRGPPAAFCSHDTFAGIARNGTTITRKSPRALRHRC